MNLLTRSRVLVIFLTLLTFFPLVFVNCEASKTYAQIKEGGLNYVEILESIDISKIAYHCEILSNFGSRVTGYQGSYLSADYIQNVFDSYGLNVSVQEYDVNVPIDKGASIIVITPEGGEEIIPAYSVWPNFVQTCPIPPEGLDGQLLYVGSGSVSEFNGMDVDNNIVLMDFNSADNWINAMKFGAKAVIFIEPNKTDLFEAYGKFSQVPVYFPRLYVSEKDGAKLLNFVKKGAKVNVKSSMQYKKVTAKNVIGIIEGSEDPNNVIIIVSHYDTWSVIPALAPGADEATSVSTLLEVARLFSIYKPKRTVWLVALSGHYQALAGAREFVEEYFFNTETFSDQKKVLTVLGLDFSTDSDMTALVCRGDFYGTITGIALYRQIDKYLSSRIFNEYLPLIGQQSGKSYNQILSDGIMSDPSMPTNNYMLDTEPFIAAHGIGVTFRTANSYRRNWGTPLSTIDKINMDNLASQVEVATCILFSIINDRGFVVDWSEIKPARIYRSTVQGGVTTGFLTVIGKTLSYNYTKGWYNLVPNLLVAVSRVPYSENRFSTIITESDDFGEYKAVGLLYGFAMASPALTVYGSGGLTYAPLSNFAKQNHYYIEAFGINSTTGEYIYAPDHGQYGSQRLSFHVLPNSQPSSSLTVVFRAANIVVLDLLNPETMSGIASLDPRYPDRPWYSNSFAVSLYDYNTLSEFSHYSSIILPANGRIMLFFVPPGVRVAIIYNFGALQTRFGVLVNSTMENPEGFGCHEGKIYSIIDYRDLYNLAFSRYQFLNISYIRDPITEIYLEKIRCILDEYAFANEKRLYDEATGYELRLWTWSAKAYAQVMNLINDISYTAVLIFSLLIPFALMMEIIIFRSSGLRRLTNILVFFIVPFAIFYSFHPGFRIATNAYIGTIGLVMLTFFIFIFIIIRNELSKLAKDVERKLVGYHAFEKGTISTVTFAFSLGVENLKRRKLRTVLISLTVTIITFSLISLTSISFIYDITFSPTGTSATYNGILLKGLPGPKYYLDSTVADYIKAVVGKEAVVCLRAWYYPQAVNNVVYANIKSSSNEYPISAVLGLSSMEPLIRSFNNSALSEGKWIDDDYAESCILPKSASDALGVKVGDKIDFQGIELSVIGIIDERILDTIHDLDGQGIIPFDPGRIKDVSFQSFYPSDEFIPLPSRLVLIVPYNFVLKIGGKVTSVVATSVNSEIDLMKLSKEIFQNLNLFVYVGLKGNTYYVYMSSVAQIQGLVYYVIPLFLGSFSILNCMLGAINERLREITTYSALGLSPKGIIIFFFAEALSYSVIGGVIGYMSGIIMNSFLTNLMPKDFILNYSSTSSLIAVCCAFASPLLSTIYPAIISSRLITPLMERKWKITTKPSGNVWTIPLPFAISNFEEVQGILLFMKEYFEAHTIESTENFIVRSIKLERLRLVTQSSLRPFEMGVLQNVELVARYSKNTKNYDFVMNIEQIGGVREVWIRSVYKFVDAVRKQLLVWRSLKPSEKERYIGGFLS